MDLRETYLRQWLVGAFPRKKHELLIDVVGAKVVSGTTDLPLDISNPLEISLTPLCGDASLRRYFRWTIGDQSFIGVDTPLESSNFAGFSALCHYWERFSIPVPMLIAEDAEQGFMLLEDLGDETLLSLVSASTTKIEQADRFYRSAIDHLITIQQTTAPDNYSLPVYDMPMLKREMGLFDEWFLGQLLNIDLGDAEKLMLQRSYSILTESALNQPKVVVHRDYHSRNLMVTDDKQLAIIDFQDAVFGPISYDLVSLLKDCYVLWPEPQRNAWLAYYIEQSIEKDVMKLGNEEPFKRWFDLMGAQRHLKAIGIFARLQVRDDKPGYLADIPRTISYLLELTDYPDLIPFLTWLREAVLPTMTASGYFPEVAAT